MTRCPGERTFKTDRCDPSGCGRTTQSLRWALWLVTAPPTFGYTDRAMIWNDLISGALLMICAALAIWPPFRFLGSLGRGGWLRFAPLDSRAAVARRV